MRSAESWDNFRATSGIFNLLIQLFVIVLLCLFLALCSSGCASGPPTQTVIQSCSGLEQWTVPTKEPPANNQTQGAEDETHIALQGALASCNLDKKSLRDAIRQFNQKEGVLK